MNPAVSVVIPVRNGAATLGAQLEALQAQEYDGELEIIVVDNGSTDLTTEVAGTFQARRWPVRIVHEPIAGANSARNAGIETATAEFVLLCDADDIVQPNWVSALARALGDADLVGGLLETASMNSARAPAMWGYPDIVRPRGRALFGFDAPWGCNCGFRRSVWKAIGGFDLELSTNRLDDIEFFVRAQVAGFRLAFADDALVCYRLRDDPRSVIKRRYQNGIGEALIAKRFRDRPPLLTSMKSATRAWASLIVRAVPALLTSNQRWRWRLNFAKRRGRLVGSIRYRVLCF